MKAQGICNPVSQRLSKRLLSIKEAGEYLGRSVWGIRELQWKGILPYVRFDRRVYFDINDLDKVIESHKERFND
jgi:Helix-turn-helix domain